MSAGHYQPNGVSGEPTTSPMYTNYAIQPLQYALVYPNHAMPLFDPSSGMTMPVEYQHLPQMGGATFLPQTVVYQPVVPSASPAYPPQIPLKESKAADLPKKALVRHPVSQAQNQNELQELRRQIDAKDAIVANLKRINYELTSQRIETVRLAKRTAEQLAQLNKEFDTHKETFSREQTKSKNTEAALSKIREELDRRLSELSTANTTITSTTAALGATQAVLDKEREEYAKSLQYYKESLHAEIEGRKKDRQHFQDVSKAHHNEVTGLNALLAQAKKINDKLREERIQEQQKAAAAKAEFEKQRDLLQSLLNAREDQLQKANERATQFEAGHNRAQQVHEINIELSEQIHALKEENRHLREIQANHDTETVAAAKKDLKKVSTKLSKTEDELKQTKTELEKAKQQNRPATQDIAAERFRIAATLDNFNKHDSNFKTLLETAKNLAEASQQSIAAAQNRHEVITQIDSELKATRTELEQAREERNKANDRTELAEDAADIMECQLAEARSQLAERDNLIKNLEAQLRAGDVVNPKFSKSEDKHNQQNPLQHPPKDKPKSWAAVARGAVGTTGNNADHSRNRPPEDAAATSTPWVLGDYTKGRGGMWRW